LSVEGKKRRKKRRRRRRVKRREREKKNANQQGTFGISTSSPTTGSDCSLLGGPFEDKRGKRL